MTTNKPIPIFYINAILCNNCGIPAGNNLPLKLYKNTNICVNCKHDDYFECNNCDKLLHTDNYSKEYDCCIDCEDDVSRELQSKYDHQESCKSLLM